MNGDASSLASLFPDGDYRFHLTLRRGEARDFFRPQDASGRVLAERAKWLKTDPVRYADLRPEGAPLLAEFARVCAGWGFAASATADVAGLGEKLEPDFLLLSADETGAFRLRGGALCFPTGWALDEKIGRTMDFIHGVVPGLNAAIGAPIHQFLSRIKPGPAFFRDNWGIVATDELNMHPSRGLPAPAAHARLDGLWLRVEHQVLFALPETDGVVFGIRIALHRLDAVARDAVVSGKLKAALRSMPPEMARYKRLDAVIPVISGVL